MKYNYDEINIGDGVYFKIQGIDNYDLYWKVIEKMENNKIQVEIKEMAANDWRIVDVKDIIRKEPRLSSNL